MYELKIKKSTVRIAIVAILICVGIGWWILSGRANSCFTTPAKDMDIGGHRNLAIHNHAELKITINGKVIPIPANIGLESQKMRPIHTHDGSGELHMEAPCQREFTLGDFFGVWNKELNQNCIFEYCNNENHTLRMKVNGQSSSEFESHIIKGNEVIEIEYS